MRKADFRFYLDTPNLMRAANFIFSVMIPILDLKEKHKENKYIEYTTSIYNRKHKKKL